MIYIGHFKDNRFYLIFDNDGQPKLFREPHWLKGNSKSKLIISDTIKRMMPYLSIKLSAIQHYKESDLWEKSGYYDAAKSELLKKYINLL